MEFPKHCEITSCTNQLNDSTVITAAEAVESDDTTAEKEDSKKGPKAPCVICFVPVTTVEVTDRSQIFEPLTQQEKEHDNVFQWFLLHLWIQSKKKIKGKLKNKIERFDQVKLYKSTGWDGGGGKSLPLPFCEECQNELIRLMEKQKMIPTAKRRKEEEDNLKSGIREVRRKMGRCEREFINSGIYDEDKRYHRVRRFIVQIQTTMVGKMGVTKTSVLEAPPALSNQSELRRPRPEEVVVEVPCVICCKALKTFPNEEKTMKRKVEDWKVFRWFLRYLQNPPGQQLFLNRKKGAVRNMAELWDGQRGESEPLQFCWECKGGILEWIGARNTVPMQKERAKEVRRMKGRMRECEDEFEGCGIYEKDWRYFNVRRKVIKVLETEILPGKPKPPRKKAKQKKKLKIKEKVGKRRNYQKKGTRKMKGLGGLGGQHGQLVEFVMENDEETGQQWQWEEDSVEDPINCVKVEQCEEGEGMELLGSGAGNGSGSLELETEDYARVQVKMEVNLEEEGEEDYMEMDPFGPTAHIGDDLDENHENQQRNCLLCYKAISKEEGTLAPVLTNDLNEQNFNSMFVLQKMLNVPKESLAGYLRDFGNPGKWVEYCVKCLCMVDRALSIQKEINQLENKLKLFQEKMVLRIQVTSKKAERVAVKKNLVTDNLNDRCVTKVTEETRQFVMSSLKLEENRKPVQLPPPPSRPKDSGQRLMNPSSAKRAKLSSAEDKGLEPRGIKDTKIMTLKTRKYWCSQCPTLKAPMSLGQFYSHLIFHAKRPLKCSICHIYWSSPTELEKNPFVKDNPSSDHVCSEATLMKIREDEKFSVGKIWSCKWCPDKFEMENERDSHEDEEHAILKSQFIMMYKCLSCSKAYQSYEEWLLHRGLEHPKIAATSCLYCDFSAAIQTKEEIDTNKMRSHVNAQHNSCASYFTFPETCDICGVAVEFGKFKDLLLHIKNAHKEVKPYQCETCGKPFAIKNYLYSHISQSHGNYMEAGSTNLIGTTTGSSKLNEIITSVQRILVPQPTDFPPTQAPATASGRTRESGNFINNGEDYNSVDKYYVEF